jgi:hypothetical protein
MRHTGWIKFYRSDKGLAGTAREWAVAAEFGIPLRVPADVGAGTPADRLRALVGRQHRLRPKRTLASPRFRTYAQFVCTASHKLVPLVWYKLVRCQFRAELLELANA